MCTHFFIDIIDKELQEVVSAVEHSALADRFLRAGIHCAHRARSMTKLCDSPHPSQKPEAVVVSGLTV